MNTQNILWSKLVPSPRNARKIKTGIDSLAANIAANGLIHGPSVTPREDGKFEVDAGERRRRAIVKLVRAGTWARDTEVPCNVIAPEDAAEISYSENTQRIAMHPADAIRAFTALAKDGEDEAAIANRHGYEAGEVRRLLALGSLSPKVLKALATDKIDVATAQAFTLTDDHQRQDVVLRTARNAYHVRQMLTDTKVATTHKLFRFVGPDAYAEAGGGITRDLFAGDEEGYADDPALVQQLAAAKFEALASEAEEAGWGKVIAAEGEPYETYQWNRLRPDQDGGYPEQVKRGGVYVISLSREGTVTSNAYSRNTRRSVSGGLHGASLPRPLYDQRMTEDLSRQRTSALQSEVAKNQHVAHAVLLDMLLPIATEGFAASHAVQLRAGPGIQQPRQEYEGNTRELASPFAGVEELLVAMPDTSAERFAWTLTLTPEDTARLLAACTGALIDAHQGKFADPERLASANRIARAVSLDMRDHWEPGVEFFGRLTRKTMLNAVTEACSADAAANCATLPKGELAIACADRIPGRGWLPPALLTPEAPEALEKVETCDTLDASDAEHDHDAEEIEERLEIANDDDPMSVAAE